MSRRHFEDKFGVSWDKSLDSESVLMHIKLYKLKLGLQVSGDPTKQWAWHSESIECPAFEKIPKFLWWLVTKLLANAFAVATNIFFNFM